MLAHCGILASGRKAARSAKRGFTLIELAVVGLVLVFTMLAAVGTAAYFFRNKEQLKSEARNLAGFLERVRTLSAINGRTYTVQYDLDDAEQRYFVWAPRKPEEGEIYQDDGEDTRVAAGFHQMPSRQDARGRRYYTVWIERIAYGDGSRARSREVLIDFHPTGGSHWHYVYLANEDGEMYTVEVNPFTGFAEVYPGEKVPEPPERLR
jgi:type II secretory pathway pseudopilin PulG